MLTYKDRLVASSVSIISQ